MSKLSTSETRRDWSDVLNRVCYGRERVVIERRGKKVAAMVPIEDLELLESLQDRMDLESARAALKQPGSKPWAVVKRELGL